MMGSSKEEMMLRKELQSPNMAEVTVFVCYKSSNLGWRGGIARP